MNTLPQTFQWTPNGFEPIAPLNDTDILVADSWRVHDGEVWGLQDHLQRFMAGIATQTQFVRSEERRVGKECRSWGWWCEWRRREVENGMWRAGESRLGDVQRG